VKVRLEATVFEPPLENALLVTLFRYALDGRHRIELDTTAPSVAAWISAQAQGLQEEIQLGLDLSAEAEALGPAATSVVIERAERSYFDQQPIRLALRDARTFLERPLYLMLEDANSDRHFLMNMLTPAEHAFINKQIEEGYLVIEHGGGITNMGQRVVGRHGDLWWRHRLFVLFDSDGLRPGAPSTQSETLKNACAPYSHYQLARRAAENYLPPASLHAWGRRGRTRAVRKSRFSSLSAFVRMNNHQRHHFNMKGGFADDAERKGPSAGDLYDSVPATDRESLNDGFGSRIAALFDSEDVREQDLRSDSGWSEMRPVVQRLLSQLR
jgi:hypothetical protein